MLRWAAYGAAAAAAVSVAGLVLIRRPFSRWRIISCLVGLLVAVLVVAVLGSWWRTAQGVPPIHDITTDTENPPRFVSVLPLRKDAPNPAEYGGAGIAAQQRAAYPDIAPAILPSGLAQAYERALRAAREMGWVIVDSSAGDGRIEATDTTFWFGFKDDIVIRIAPSAQGSRVDVRSVSRVGRSDVGTNAKRIRKYLKRLQEP